MKDLASSLSSHFISVQQLSDRLGSPGLLVIDCRFRLQKPDWGQTQYQLGHIPGAHYLHLDHDLSRPVAQQGGRHPLPERQSFIETLSRLGIERGQTEVVIYDDSRFAFAARLWWLLKYFGHDRAKILDGGYGAWQAKGLPTSAQVPAPSNTRSPFIAQMCPELIAARAEAIAISETQTTLLDCRDRARYLGEVEPIDPIAGHIPGAKNSPWKAVSTESGFAQPLKTQQKLWETYDPDREIILYCGSGVTACVNWLSLELSGYHRLKLYPGGWSDWCSYSSDPTER